MRHAALLKDKKGNVIGFSITRGGVNLWIKKFGISSVRMLNNSVADFVFKNGHEVEIEITLDELKNWKLLYGAELWIDGELIPTEDNFLMRTIYKPAKRRYKERKNSRKGY